jgi:hypothetical protein
MIDVSPAAADDDAVVLASVERPIDLVHLARMTLGDRELEREVLQLFDRQASMLVARLRETAPVAGAAVAHTLKGSARGIGAWRVASAAEALEHAVAGGGEADFAGALQRLEAAAAEARSVIAELLRTN